MEVEAAAGLAGYVRTRRLRAGLTQEALAERAGLTVDTVGALERGLRRRLYPHTARAIADALELSAGERAVLAELASGRPRTPVASPPGSALPAPSSPPGAAIPPIPPTVPEEARPSHNLPAPLTRLIGRDIELAQVQERLSQGRLLTLTGPGGIGKTRLVLAAAHALRPRFPDGVWWVELAPLADPALVLGAVANVLGVHEVQGQSLVVTLSAALQARRLLVVLDNFEQVLDAATDVAALLSACPGLVVLATSRAPLRISGEREMLVPPLRTPGAGAESSVEVIGRYAAVALFQERATAVNADFLLTAENAPAVAAICDRLDGMPLAIELAAARVKLFAPPALLARLDKRLAFLTGGAHDLPARQRTLRAAIAWSYDLLTAPEQNLFQRLAVFVGGFTLAAAEAICSPDDSESPDLVDTLSALIDRSLVRPDEAPAAARLLSLEGAGPAETPGSQAGDSGELGPRFAMFETIRDFALEQLSSASDSAHWHQQHAAYYCTLMESAEADFDETAPIAATRLARQGLEPEQGNFRAALQWASANGQGELALRLAGSLCAAWVPAGNVRVTRRWLEHSAGTMREARSAIERALAIDAPSTDSVRAKAYFGLGRVLLFQWDDPSAERDYAVRAFEQSLALYRRGDDRRATARCLIELGAAHFDREEASIAALLFQEALSVAQAIRDLVSTGWALIGLGRIAQAQGDVAQAADLFEQGLSWQREARNEVGIAGALDGLGLARQAQRAYSEALTCFEEAVAVRRRMGAQAGLPVALQRLGILLGVAGEVRAAIDLLQESLVIGQRMGNPWDTANALLSLGSLSAGQGASERGARLFGAGEALMESRGIVLAADYRSLFSRAVAGVRRSLGDAAFASECEAGRRMTVKQAVEEALQVSAGREA